MARDTATLSKPEAVQARPRDCAQRRTAEEQADRRAGHALAAHAAEGHAPSVAGPRPPHACGPLPRHVQRALAEPGEPLAASERAFFEPRLGADFSQVRLHHGALAEAAAAREGAAAFAVGSAIVFGRDRRAPRTARGRGLLAHELAHLAQQAERGAAQLQRREDYDVTRFTLSPPAAPITLPEAQQLANDKVTEGELAKAAVAGAKAGSQAEIMLWVILSQVGAKTQWGKEVDLVAAIGWPAKQGDPSPQGKVTVRIDEKGAGTATLVSEGAVAAPAAHADRAKAEAALKASYGLAAITDGDATWTVGELNLVAAAFAKLPAADIGALKGVELKRVAAIDGAHAGRFSSEQNVEGETVTNTATLELADDVFPAAQTNFVGGATNAAPEGVLTVVHEVGHAVASKAVRDATQPYHVALAKANKAVDVNNTAFAESQTADADYQTLQNDPTAKPADLAAAKAKAATANATAAAKFKAMNTAQTAAKAKRSAITAATARSILETRLATQLTTAKSALASAKAAAATIGATDAAPSESYRSACGGVATELDALAKGYKDLDADLGALIGAVESAVATRVSARDAVASSAPGDAGLAAYAAVDAAQDACVAAAIALRDGGEQSRRVFRFAEFVNRERVEPFTQYARDKWPDEPEEFYAEAYALWLSDPEYMKSNAKVLYDWFAAGEHRK